MSRLITAAAVHFNHLEAYAGRQARTAALQQWAAAGAQLAGSGVDLVVACEGMGSVGQDLAQAETVASGGPLLDAYRDLAVRERCTVVGSLKLREGSRVFNALLALGPDGGVLDTYRKSFLTAGEIAGGLSHGPGPVAIDTPAGRLGGAICYDLKFDELREAYQGLHLDVVAFSSMFHGGFQQQAWAFGTRAYLVGACKDGYSSIVAPLGRILASASAYTQIACARLCLDRLLMPFDADQVAALRRLRQPGLSIEVAPDLGVVLLSSTDPTLTCLELSRRFSLTSLDNHLAGARAQRPGPLAAAPALPVT